MDKKISLTEAARLARGELKPPSVPIQFDGVQPIEATGETKCEWCGFSLRHVHFINGEDEWATVEGDRMRCDADPDKTRMSHRPASPPQPATREKRLRIPSDLREEYEEWTTCALRDSADHYRRRCIALVERIAALEDRNG